jgi:hypothetical protein
MLLGRGENIKARSSLLRSPGPHHSGADPCGFGTGFHSQLSSIIPVLSSGLMLSGWRGSSTEPRFRIRNRGYLLSSVFGLKTRWTNFAAAVRFLAGFANQHR